MVATMTQERVDKVLDAISNGSSFKDAAKIASIVRNDIYVWEMCDQDFADKLNIARRMQAKALIDNLRSSVYDTSNDVLTQPDGSLTPNSAAIGRTREIQNYTARCIGLMDRCLRDKDAAVNVPELTAANSSDDMVKVLAKYAAAGKISTGELVNLLKLADAKRNCEELKVLSDKVAEIADKLGIAK